MMTTSPLGMRYLSLPSLSYLADISEVGSMPWGMLLFALSVSLTGALRCRVSSGHHQKLKTKKEESGMDECATPRTATPQTYFEVEE